MDLTVFEQAGLSQREAAELVGVSRIAFHHWLKGAEPHAANAKTLKELIVLTKVALKMKMLPDRLPPAKGFAAERRQVIADTYKECRHLVEQLKARRTAG